MRARPDHLTPTAHCRRRRASSAHRTGASIRPVLHGLAWSKITDRPPRKRPPAMDQATCRGPGISTDAARLSARVPGEPQRAYQRPSATPTGCGSRASRERTCPSLRAFRAGTQSHPGAAGQRVRHLQKMRSRSSGGAEPVIGPRLARTRWRRPVGYSALRAIPIPKNEPRRPAHHRTPRPQCSIDASSPPTRRRSPPAWQWCRDRPRSSIR